MPWAEASLHLGNFARIDEQLHGVLLFANANASAIADEQPFASAIATAFGSIGAALAGVKQLNLP